MHNLPVYSIELLKCQYPNSGQFFPYKVFMRVIPNATSHVERHFLFSCPHADCLEGECLLLGEIWQWGGVPLVLSGSFLVGDECKRREEDGGRYHHNMDNVLKLHVPPPPFFF